MVLKPSGVIQNGPRACCISIHVHAFNHSHCALLSSVCVLHTAGWNSAHHHEWQTALLRSFLLHRGVFVDGHCPNVNYILRVSYPPLANAHIPFAPRYSKIQVSEDGEVKVVDQGVLGSGQGQMEENSQLLAGRFARWPLNAGPSQGALPTRTGMVLAHGWAHVPFLSFSILYSILYSIVFCIL